MPPALGPTGQTYAKRHMPQAAYGMRGMSTGLDLKPVENDPTKKNDLHVRKKDNSMPAPACRVGRTHEDRFPPALGPVPSRASPGLQRKEKFSPSPAPPAPARMRIVSHRL